MNREWFLWFSVPIQTPAWARALRSWSSSFLVEEASYWAQQEHEGCISLFPYLMCPHPFISALFPQTFSFHWKRWYFVRTTYFHFVSTLDSVTTELCISQGDETENVCHMGMTSSFRGLFHPSCFLVHRKIIYKPCITFHIIPWVTGSIRYGKFLLVKWFFESWASKG